MFLLTSSFLLQRTSVIVPRLHELEKQFFDLVHAGNEAHVAQFLNNNPNFNINAINFQGVTALHIAVRNRDVPMVEYLLSSPDIDPGDTHLYAIVNDDQKILNLILNKLNKLTAGLEYVGVTQSADFPDDATPLLIAAQCGHFELIDYLRKRHHNIPRPHPANCICEECKYEFRLSRVATNTRSGTMVNQSFRAGCIVGRSVSRRAKGLDEINDTVVRLRRSERERSDLLTIEKMRLFTYKAITNPAYICQTVDDPILEAFNISYELKEAANWNKEFYHEYKHLSQVGWCPFLCNNRSNDVHFTQRVSEFATELISCARTIDEVEIILKQPTGFAISSNFVYPRLLFALHYQQRSFVAHANVQQLMKSRWVEDWYEWYVMKNWIKWIHVMLRVVMLPVIFAIILCMPNSRYSKSYQSPVNKFISYTASYIVFLFLVFLQSSSDKTNQLRGPPNTGIQTILAVYILSYTWATIRLCLIHGPRRFFSKYWYWFEMVMLFLFIVTFLFWITAAIDVHRNGQLELERKYWNMYDPTLVGEGIFCLATIMAFSKLFYFCLLDYNLGPLQLSLGKMIGDVVKFAILYAIILFAFTAATCKLYQYYDGMVQIDDESKIKTQQVSSFVNFSAALKTFFWAFFCMSPMESADVIIENLPGESKHESIINHHTFTQNIGYIAFAAYTFIVVVLILNMLIACMSNTMTQVTENMIVEWTFGRTETYVDFMLTTALPPPLNMIPTLIGIKPIVEYVKLFFKPQKDKRARWDLNHCCFIVSTDLQNTLRVEFHVFLYRMNFHKYFKYPFDLLIGVLESDKDRYFSMVMSQLVQRYFRKKNKEAEENDTERLRNEIMELTTVLRDALSID
ncbi:LOW QUALITY PROTEIN: short transient receptor potential channel 4 [Lasioglossum baleicum]|uniref:LOW QUALITY PROTEIN: short transient receptor potential channel 4 n=1 Tax=Lasioglossum baleicum TaxID=434251 RepID=UPI003FCCC444